MSERWVVFDHNDEGGDGFTHSVLEAQKDGSYLIRFGACSAKDAQKLIEALTWLETLEVGAPVSPKKGRTKEARP